MNFTTKIIGIFAIIVIAVLAIFYLNNKDSTNYDSFAQCLTSKGMKMYGAFWCSHCQDQKKDFGSSMKYIDYVECSTADGKGQLPICTTAGIKSYPTWQLSGGGLQTGVLSFRELAALSGCSLPV